MIVLLSYSTNLYTNDYHISSTGKVIEEDSVFVSYADLKVVNSKLIELKYEKETNKLLKNIIKNDSTIIDTLTIENVKLNSKVKNLDNINKEYKKQRNVGFCVGIVGIITTVLMLIK